MAGVHVYLHPCFPFSPYLALPSALLASSKARTPSPPNTEPRGKEDPMPLLQRLVFLPMGLSQSLACSELITWPDNEDAIILDLWDKIQP